MCTPKEKAEELLEKFKNIKSEYPCFIISINQSKKCALIAVHEILDLYPAFAPLDSWEMEQHEFWNQVKTEIEKL